MKSQIIAQASLRESDLLSISLEPGIVCSVETETIAQALEICTYVREGLITLSFEHAVIDTDRTCAVRGPQGEMFGMSPSPTKATTTSAPSSTEASTTAESGSSSRNV